jgi:rhodanese-related sulfurtransferase
MSIPPKSFGPRCVSTNVVAMNVPVPSIGVSELDEALRGGASLIDVREPQEFEEVRAVGARLIPLGQVPDRVAEMPTEQRFYVICHVGGRSLRAAAFLRQQGLDAVNVEGGTDAWVAAGLATQSGPAPE